MTFAPIHKHILIKAHILNPFKTQKQAKRFLKDLVALIGMTPVTNPAATYVAEEGNKGFTGSINLATSHIAFHIWDETGLLMTDVYSCKDFDPIVIIDFIDHRLELDNTHEHTMLVLDRETMKSELETF